jgi:hypothetical protein
VLQPLREHGEVTGLEILAGHVLVPFRIAGSRRR